MKFTGKPGEVLPPRGFGTAGTDSAKGPQMKPPKRPRDFSQAAKFVIEVATGEARGPRPYARGAGQYAAAAMGRRGGAARARNLTEGRRSEIAKQAAAKRWKKD